MKKTFELILGQSANLVTLLSCNEETDSAACFKANIIIVPTAEALKHCQGTYERWYKDSKGFSLNLELHHDGYFYIRAYKTPLAQSTKKRNVTDATPEKMAATFRTFIRSIIKEMEKSQEAHEKQKKAGWAISDISRHYEKQNDNPQRPFSKLITSQSNVSATFNTNVAGEPLKKVNYHMIPSKINDTLVSGEITLVIDTMSREQLQQVLDKIAEISALS